MSGASFKSTEPHVPGVLGESSTFNGVLGVTTAEGHAGVAGVADVTVANGVYGRSAKAQGVIGYSSAAGYAGVAGVNLGEAGYGVLGSADKGAGVVGRSKSWKGVYGHSETDHAIWGEADSGTGVAGIAKKWHGVYGESHSATGGAGVWGEHKGAGAGAVGKSVTGAGVWGQSDQGEAVHAETRSPTVAAVAAYHLNPAGTGAAVYAKKDGQAGHAGFFDGHVHVGRTLTVVEDVVLLNADCAEDFTVVDPAAAEPGDVMVLAAAGKLAPCSAPYDRRAAGVLSGAGSYRPALVLDRREPAPDRMPLALVGKVYCKVDADHGPIAFGDLLTTSATPGHAMRASDRDRAFGAVIGKALADCPAGRAMIPILVALQ